MIVNYREKMREYLKEPNEICNHYGKWGILNREQRDLITRLLNEMEREDNYIKKMQQENAQLKDKLNKINDLLNKPIFEYDNIPCNIENEIQQMKDILKEN